MLEVLSFENYFAARVAVACLCLLYGIYYVCRLRKVTGAARDEALDERQQLAATSYDELRLQEVLDVEENRKLLNYKPGWTYYRCAEKGLLKELAELRARGKIPRLESSQSSSSFTKEAPLDVELVPSSCWFSNLRSVLGAETWKKLKRRVYKNANYCCEICNGRGPEWPVEAHETWAYDDERRIQRLTTIRALCPDCHEVKHFGLASLSKRAAFARAHLMHINQWSGEQADHYIEKQFDVWSDRSKVRWSVDFSRLLDFGFSAEEIASYEAVGIKERADVH